MLAPAAARLLRSTAYSSSCACAGETGGCVRPLLLQLKGRSVIVHSPRAVVSFSSTYSLLSRSQSPSSSSSFFSSSSARSLSLISASSSSSSSSRTSSSSRLQRWRTQSSPNHHLMVVQRSSKQQQQQQQHSRLSTTGESSNSSSTSSSATNIAKETSSATASTKSGTTGTTKTTKTTTSNASQSGTKGSGGMGVGRGPVTWTSLFLAAVVGASLVATSKIVRERRLEQVVGKVVSSESDGWSPDPERFAKRKYVKTTDGWFPLNDAFGASGKPAIGGPWTLVDLEGNLVTEKSFEGKWLLLYFGFARCPDICPSEMVKIGAVIDSLKVSHPELAQQLVPVFVSVDPARDSIQALASFGNDFHPDYVFLTGTPGQVQKMTKMYRVYVSKADESNDGDYLVDHSIVTYFHDATGDLADCFTQSMRVSDFTSKIVELMTKKEATLLR